MGILNVTPDSFSDGGKYLSHSKAIEHAIEMINLGADIIDIGGESSRPGAEKVSIDEEIKRVIPVIEAIHRMEKNIPISIDTTKAEVAHAALQAGATIVNDVSAFSVDERILEVVYNFNATYVLMHINGNPQNMQDNPFYDEPVSEIYNFLARKLDLLNELEIEKIIIDPGIGFGKRVSDNFKLIERLDEFKTLGKPIMVGLSKKSFLGKSLNLDVNSRENATSISEYMAVLNGARIIRTHNVQNVTEMKKLFQFYKYPNITSVYD
jgi:dihydropteroate synthase